eukprot:jgi/Botrbrau1/21785/Bobra.0190s0012.1
MDIDKNQGRPLLITRIWQPHEAKDLPAAMIDFDHNRSPRAVSEEAQPCPGSYSAPPAAGSLPSNEIKKLRGEHSAAADNLLFLKRHCQVKAAPGSGRGRPGPPPKSKFKSVTLHNGKYECHLWFGGQQKHIASFDIEKMAAAAHDLAALVVKHPKKHINFYETRYQGVIDGLMQIYQESNKDFIRLREEIRMVVPTLDLPEVPDFVPPRPRRTATPVEARLGRGRGTECSAPGSATFEAPAVRRSARKQTEPERLKALRGDDEKLNPKRIKRP